MCTYAYVHVCVNVCTYAYVCAQVIIGTDAIRVGRRFIEKVLTHTVAS